MALLSSLPPRLLPHPQRLDGAGAGRRGFRGGLETDARRTAVQPQRDAVTGADRDSPRAGASGSEAGRRAGLQLPASERLGQDRDAHPEILHQTVYRLAGRHTFHPERGVPGQRSRHAIRES